MVLARGESVYINEQKKEEKRSKTYRKKRKSFIFEKVIIMGIIGVAFAFSILVLTRFMTITETRYGLTGLEKQLERLEIEKTKLKIEIEKVSKSGWIESEAETRLQMNYPTAEQTICINVDPAKVAMLTSKINNSNYGDSTESKGDKNLYGFFKKLISYTKI
ncbi:MAG TPA: cell division protein FtsL [Clostridia bacterium]|nr:cell division protein FtsL [Clostridia bacterium]